MRTGLPFVRWFLCATGASTSAAMPSESRGVASVERSDFHELCLCFTYYSLWLGFCVWVREVSYLARNVGQPAPK